MSLSERRSFGESVLSKQHCQSSPQTCQCSIIPNRPQWLHLQVVCSNWFRFCSVRFLCCGLFCSSLAYNVRTYLVIIGWRHPFRLSNRLLLRLLHSSFLCACWLDVAIRSELRTTWAHSVLKRRRLFIFYDFFFSIITIIFIICIERMHFTKNAKMRTIGHLSSIAHEA